VLPNCTSWQVPGQTTFCESTPGAQGYPFNNGVPEAVPGTSSKCNCGVITLPVIVQKPSATVAKGCVTANSPAPTNPDAVAPAGTNQNCSSGVEGTDEVTYTIAITNTSNFGSLTLGQVTDSVYGTIFGTGSFTGDTNNGCTSTTINAGSTVTCTFTAHKAGDPSTATVMDSATAAGTSGGGNWGPTGSDTVTVTPTEAPSAATVTKGLGSPNLTGGCATANFTVDVQNTSNNLATAGVCNLGVTPHVCSAGNVGATCTQNSDCNVAVVDETESLTGLSDNAFSNITVVGGNVLGTTCGQPLPANGVPGGAGTLSTLNGAGPLPATINPGSHYQCEFNASFCAASLQTIPVFGTGSCNTSTGAFQNGSTLHFCNADADCGTGGSCNLSTRACSSGTLTTCSADVDCDSPCLGIPHTDTVTATILGDEASGTPLAGDPVTPTGNNSLTVDVSLSATASH
jgi:hypothetical protein